MVGAGPTGEAEGDTRRSGAGPPSSANLRALMATLPLPLAQLVRRALNGKSAVERHHGAFYLAECALKLAAAARVGVWLERALSQPTPELARRMEALVLPSLGHWCELLRETGAALAQRPDAALLPLAGEAAELSRKRPEWTGVAAFAKEGVAAGVLRDEPAKQAMRRGALGFFDLVVAYRNEVIGHGAQRDNAFYDRFARLLLDALGEVLRERALFGGLELAQARLEADGERSHTRWYALTGLAGLPRDDDAGDAVPGQLYFVGASGRVALHPLVVYRQHDELGREQVGLLNRTARKKADGGGAEIVRSAEYLDYASGQAVAGVDARAALTSLLSRLRGRDATAADLDAAVTATQAESAAEPTDEVAAGAVVGDFELLGELGRGAMGVVYKARQRSLGRIVALKVLPPALASDASARKRFKKEIAALARCDHPNVVRILATGSDERHEYYAMEYVDGIDLGRAAVLLSAWKAKTPLFDGHLAAAVATSTADKSRSDARRAAAGPGAGADEDDGLPEVPPAPPTDIPTGRALADKLAELFAGAAMGLAHLHEAGVLHRDLKPGNLMLTADGKRLVIMDLGLAKLADESQALTSADVKILGTLRYMAPEQLQRRLVEVDARADVYGLGASLYEVATGRPFFDGETEQRLVQQVLNEEPVPPRRADPSLRADLATVIETATAKLPARRYASAGAFAADLAAVAADRPIKARPVGPLTRVALLARRNRGATMGLGAVVALGLVAGFVAWRATRLDVGWFTNVVDREGVWVGVGELAGPAGRETTRRITRRGGKVLEYACVNARGAAADCGAVASAEFHYGDDGKVAYRVERSPTGKFLAKYAYAYRGTTLQIVRLDRNDLPQPETGDLAMYRFGFDERGFENKVTFFNDRGSPRQSAGVYGYDKKTDARGMPVALVFLDADGSPVVRTDGVARATIRWDERGNELERTYSTVEGKPALNALGVAGMRQTFDDRGNLVERTFVGVDGQPAMHKDGYATWRQRFDESGCLVEKTFFGPDDRPIVNRLGFSAMRSTCDERGRENQRGHVGPGGEAVLLREGFSSYRMRHDERGNEIERAFFGTDGLPVLNAGGAAVVRTRYDERGNTVEVASFGIDGRPTIVKAGRATVRYRHDERDNEVEIAYFGADGARVVARDGCAVWRIRRDDRGKETERACLGADERPLATPEGWATVRSKIDDHGKPVERAYFGAGGEPVQHKDGYAIVRSEYDERGNESGRSYFGPNGARAPNAEGTATWKAKYDERGRVTEETLFDAAGKPAASRRGWAVRKLRYDDHGNVTERAYFGADGAPVQTDEGFSIERSRWDARDNELERTFFGANGEPIADKSGAAGWRARYDDAGRLLEKVYVDLAGKPVAPPPEPPGK